MEKEGKPTLLVLCIDRDNDIGAKTGLPTPIVGRDKCIVAATRLALADPEEADANTVFAAVKEHDELTHKGYLAEVAVVAGTQKRGVEADEKIMQETKSILNSYKVDGIVFVSDGAEDEFVIPIIQNLKPVISVRRVVIKHSESVEASYIILSKYLKMLIYDPRYSRFFLGVPGVLLLTFGILTVLGKTAEAIAASLLILGLAFVVRGFDLDKLASALTQMRPSGYLRLFSTLAAVLILISSLYVGFTTISGTPEYAKIAVRPELFFEYGPYLIGLFLQETVNLIWIGFGVFLAGSVLYHWIRQSYKLVRTATTLLILLLLYFPMTQISLILLGKGSPAYLISLLLIGLAILFLVVSLVYQYIIVKRLRG
ncbi:MAG: DUF373 family protein [Nitrososphaerales archaeon]